MAAIRESVWEPRSDPGNAAGDEVTQRPYVSWHESHHAPALASSELYILIY